MKRLLINAIILSAGNSSRMVTPKALLRYNNKTFLECCIDSLSHELIKSILIVTGYAHTEIESFVIRNSLPVTRIQNPHPDQGQYSSLQIALSSLSKNIDAVIVHLVDHPLVKKKTVDAILNYFFKSNANIIIPSYQHRRGHPVLYSSKLFREIITSNPGHGARSIIDLHKNEIEYVNVDDEGIRIDIDTREEYETYCGT